MEVIRPRRWSGEAATGPQAEGGTCVLAVGPFPRPGGPLARVVWSEPVRQCPSVRSFVPYGTRPAVVSSWGTNCVRRPPRRSLRLVYRGY